MLELLVERQFPFEGPPDKLSGAVFHFVGRDSRGEHEHQHCRQRQDHERVEKQSHFGEFQACCSKAGHHLDQHTVTHTADV